jgi:hypothetical protein
VSPRSSKMMSPVRTPLATKSLTPAQKSDFFSTLLVLFIRQHIAHGEPRSIPRGPKTRQRGQDDHDDQPPPCAHYQVGIAWSGYARRLFYLRRWGSGQPGYSPPWRSDQARPAHGSSRTFVYSFDQNSRCVCHRICSPFPVLSAGSLPFHLFRVTLHQSCVNRRPTVQSSGISQQAYLHQRLGANMDFYRD